MRAKPTISIVGAGNLANALAIALRRAGYKIDEVVARSRGPSLTKAKTLARQTGARASLISAAALPSKVVWLCVPDAQVAPAAAALAAAGNWKQKIALHSSGALSSDDLAVLRRQGASVASVHPLMTFVRGSQPSLQSVPFAVEGDGPAVRVAHRIVKDLGAAAYPIKKADKAAYHAWGTFASPLVTALLATTERVAEAADVEPSAARRRMIPILIQTLANYAAFGAPGAFSGPIVRGDVETVKRHLQVLRKEPAAREVYLALGRAALRYLPAKNKTLLTRILDSARR
jgi:predicted short-subunit dehydrogenase-like oxidoreductase (DUF2520 family)